MKFDHVPTYSASDLERKAQDLLDQQLGNDFRIPVDVEIMLERLKGVHLDIKPALRSRYQIEGIVCRDTQSGDLWVFIDEELADYNHNRYRMTVAEELGHVILHRAAMDQIESLDDFLELQRCEKWMQMERNAKRFAAATLMPATHVLDGARELYPKLVTVVGFLNPDAILGTLAAKLASRFEVSTQSMRFRLKEFPANVEEKVRQAMHDRLSFI